MASINGCDDIPEHELCVGFAEGSSMLMCNDPRRNVEDYDRPLTRDDLCTNSSDYAALKELYERSISECQETKAKAE